MRLHKPMSRQKVLPPNYLDFLYRIILVVAKGNLALAQGNLDEVKQILKTFQKKMKTNQSAYERGLWSLLEGKFQLDQG